jgi:hypothetical protein
LSRSINLSGLNLFPNLSKGAAYFELNSAAQVIVFNQLGEILISKDLNQGRNELDLLGFSPGIYIVNLKINDQTKTLKVIKQ